MRITQETDYAFRIVTHLARNENDVVKAPKIAQDESITLGFTLRILRKLNLSGITDSKRGVNGGYYLNKPKEDINLYDIILAIEGPIVINRCLEEDLLCNKNEKEDVRYCKYHLTLYKIQNNIINSFKALTIDKFV